VSALDGTVFRLDPERGLVGGWVDYVIGVIRVLQQTGAAPAGARLAVASTVPVGAGLSSSAALTVSVSSALSLLSGRRLAPTQLAEAAYRAEHDEVGVRCGRMDQTIAAFAKPGTALLVESAGGAMRQVPLPGRVWVLETGVSHRLAAGGYNERRSECEQALALLREAGMSLDHLAEIEPAQLDQVLRHLPGQLIPRVRHVVTETGRTRTAVGALAAGDVARLGGLLFEGHASLRDDYACSCAEADLLVESAARHGAWGARLTGAGWGGAVILLADPRQQARIVACVRSDFRARHGRLPVTWSTRAAGGARRERIPLT
jgi:galactokinase